MTTVNPVQTTTYLLDLARLLGADAGLQKPVSTPELMGLVNGLLAP